MKINLEARRFEYLVELIKQEHTGTADELAKRVGISRSKLFELIEELKQADVHVKFDRQKKTFRFIGSIKIKVQQPITIETAQK